jgi:hypothetical protein
MNIYKLAAEMHRVFCSAKPEFEYLNLLRDHDRLMSMAQAARCLEEAFGLDQREAKKVLLEWMQWVQKNAHTKQHS